MARKETGPILNGIPDQLPDIDPEETEEWLASLEGAIEAGGRRRARYLMLKMLERARAEQVGVPSLTTTDYINTIGPDAEPWFPGDEEMERRYRAWIRWNAAVMVHRAQRPGIGVGGHISTYASAATLYEVGYNHFWRGRDHPGGGDQVYFQGHATPGMYARAFLEGRLTEDQLNGFRQEHSHYVDGELQSVPSYPHPRNMPDFWQFPTVSMGLSPMAAIHQAQFNKYMHNRDLKDTSEQHVWAFLGDGEFDEPESRGLLHVAANDELDNLTFVVNCNLQRLDGPVRGNGKIVQELESFFRGAGWNVIKVVWGRGWDTLLAGDHTGALVNLMNRTPDGDYQTYRANDGAYVRENFFAREPRAKALVENWSDEDIWWKLKRGGHDYRKVYAAYKAATEHTGQPTVILAKTIKGYSLGEHFAGRNATHQMKKMTLEDLKNFRDGLRIPISDEELEKDPALPPYYNPGPEDETIQYMLDRRQRLGGAIPARRPERAEKLKLPEAKLYDTARKGSGKQEVASTMAFVRILRDLMRDKEFGKHVVPIVPDEARTFGMDAFFSTAKIYNVHGQNYTSVDADLMLAYKESEQGQMLHLGINEAGSVAAFTAAGTSYDTHGIPMVPVYVFYSMFGFQRTGDGLYAAADQLARGFLIGATAGRTTLTGEGLQHADGQSPLLASTNPAVVSYDPAYSYEIAHIMEDGLRRMYGEAPEDVIYYLTVYNEPMIQPPEPEGVDTEGILRGMHLITQGEEADGSDATHVRLLASGVGVPWALEAQELLKSDWGVSADVWSVTSWSELRREAMACDEDAFLHPDAERRVPYVTRRLQEGSGPVGATSHFMRAVQDQIAPWVPEDYHALGADGFGFADTRPAARRYFHIDGPSMTVKALQMLADRGEVDPSVPKDAAEKYQLLDVTAGASGNEGGEGG